MADNNVKITFEVDGIQQTVGSVEELQDALKGVEKQAKKTEGSIGDVGDAAEDAAKKAEESAKASDGFFKVVDEATGGLATKVKEVGTGLFNMGKKAVTAFKGAVQGASAMGKALIATGIGALVVAVGLLVAYWDDIKNLVSGVSAEQKKLLKDTEATRDAAQENLEATEASENSLKLAGKSEKEIRQLKIQQTNEIIVASEALLEQQKSQKKAQVEAAERNKKILQGIIRFLTLPLTLILSTIDAITKAMSYIPGLGGVATNLEASFSGGLANLVFDPSEVAEEGDATIAETEKQLAALKNKRDGYLLQQRDEDNKAREERTANAKASADEQAAIQAELNAELERLRASNIKGEEAQALALLELQRKTARQALVDKGASDELLLEFDQNYETQAQAIRDKFAQERAAKEAADEEKRKAARDEANAILAQAYLDGLEQQFERARVELQLAEQTALEKLRIAGATAEELQYIEDSYAAKRMQLAKEESDYKKQLAQAETAAKLDVITQGFDIIQQYTEEGSAANKAAAVASATINTYQAATNALANTPAPPPFPQIAAGLTIVAGLLNVKKILSTKVPGDKGSSASAAGGAPAPTTSSVFSAVSGAAGGNTQLAAAGAAMQGGQTPPPVKAYVIAQDVSNAQEANAKIENLSKL